MNLLKTGFVALIVGALTLFAFNFRLTDHRASARKAKWERPKGCVYRTLFGEESSENQSKYKTPDNLVGSLESGLGWMVKAQQINGGWGAGSHQYQNVMDPHAVPADPATTAMVSMALLRSGNTLTSGQYSKQLGKSLEYLLNAVEETQANATNITTLTNTQIQTKLGGNIDVILTSQFLGNVLDHLNHNAALKKRTQHCLDICVGKIQKAQSSDGSIDGAGWAGVLQSSLANNALEMAETKGAKVDKDALAKSRDYQKGNYDSKTGKVNTDRGAGVMLYSISGTPRASAKEAREVQEAIDDARKKGKLAKNAPASVDNLVSIGYGEDEAQKLVTSYEVYNSAKVVAQQDEVMNGFGSNGGEEFISYLQTGESMVINKDNDWKNWYDNISGRILKIQNDDGSWNGHHCITSPVFCTATCLLILSINNDIESLTKLGGN
jgi:hypothetical protein